MADPTTALDKIMQVWPVLTTFLGILLYTYKAKRIEILKLRINFMLDAYNTLSQLHGSVQTWAHPIGKMEEKDKQLNEKLQEIWPEAEQAINKASLVVDPKLIEEMRSMFTQTNLMLAEYGNWKMFLEAQKSGADYNKEIKKMFTISKEELPQKMEETLRNILQKFQYELNGYLTVRWWNIKKYCYNILCNRTKK